MSSEITPLHQDRDAAGDLDVLDRPAHLGLGFLEGLAALHGDGAGEVVEMLSSRSCSLNRYWMRSGGRDAPPAGKRLRGSLGRLRPLRLR